MKFLLAHYNVAVQPVSHYVTDFPLQYLEIINCCQIRFSSRMRRISPMDWMKGLIQNYLKVVDSEEGQKLQWLKCHYNNKDEDTNQSI